MKFTNILEFIRKRTLSQFICKFLELYLNFNRLPLPLVDVSPSQYCYCPTNHNFKIECPSNIVLIIDDDDDINQPIRNTIFYYISTAVISKSQSFGKEINICLNNGQFTFPFVSSAFCRSSTN